MPSKLSLVILLAAVTALGPFAMQALAPALPAIAADFEVSPAVSQLMLSLSLAAMAVATLIWGPVSDRFGRRPVLILGMVLATLGSVIAAVTGDVYIAVLGRLLQAGGAVAGMVLARTIAQDLYGRDGAAGVIGQITAAMVVAPMIAPALSGVAVEHLGWRSIFAMVALAGAGLVAWTWASLPETAPARAGHGLGDILTGFREISTRRGFWAYAGYGMFSFASFLYFVGAAPYVMLETYGQGPAVYGLYFIGIAGAYMASNMVCGALTARFGGDRVLLAGALLAIAAMLGGLLALAAGLHHPLVLFGAAGLHSIAAGLSVPNAMAGAVGAVPERAGAASGLLGFAQFMLGGLTAQVAGAVPHDSAVPVLGGMLVLLTLALLVHLGCRRSGPVRGVS